MPTEPRFTATLLRNAWRVTDTWGLNAPEGEHAHKSTALLAADCLNGEYGYPVHPCPAGACVVCWAESREEQPASSENLCDPCNDAVGSFAFSVAS